MSTDRTLILRATVAGSWMAYEPVAVLQALAAAKAAILALTQMPYQRSWADELQQLQLKREVAGTSRIEGAEFTDRELDAALRETPAQLETRSQRQAAAAVATYRWIAGLPTDRPVDDGLVNEVQRRLVAGCDDDHCPPGELRPADQNATFGTARHWGVEGGDECVEAFRALMDAVRTALREHDPLLQVLALHYHLAAMHPFLDGNGRTARALEALMLQRMGLRDSLFIAMSNHYYEEKPAYLQALHDARAGAHDLTPFLRFALSGVERQCRRLFDEIRFHIAIGRNTQIPFLLTTERCYGFEGATLPDGTTAHFLAMELVPGEDLSERLKRGPIPVGEALEIAKQIAEALEEAHERWCGRTFPGMPSRRRCPRACAALAAVSRPEPPKPAARHRRGADQGQARCE